MVNKFKMLQSSTTKPFLELKVIDCFLNTRAACQNDLKIPLERFINNSHHIDLFALFLPLKKHVCC